MVVFRQMDLNVLKCFLTPKRHILARNRVVWLLRVKIGEGPLLRRAARTHKNNKEKPNRTISREKNPLRDCYEILHKYRYPRRNQVVAKYGEYRLRGLGVARCQVSGFPVDLCSPSVQHCRTTVRVCDFQLQRHSAVVDDLPTSPARLQTRQISPAAK